ncbi:hypothetical protein F5884DRAFT_801112 [Xylogone sp. PMI_703]|nr:hypothetical protein F5884DRAFT_801112 [Xylogone sp. PMI_703]
MEEEHRPSSAMDRTSIDGLISADPAAASGDATQMASDMPQSRPVSQHTRAGSSISRRPNRLSLVFPVSTSINGIESGRQTPTSSTAPSLPATPAEATRVAIPNESGAFLVALAAQERKVLELKEELNKAEADLQRLKKHWAIHEASKKTSQQGLQNLVSDGRKSVEEQASLRRSIELERRKSLLGGTNAPKDSRRRIITGGHTRTLSLLSPDSPSCPKPFEPSQDPNQNPPLPGLSRSTTMPDTSQGIALISSRLASRQSYQNGATGVRQIADDVKAGLWTFLEDLRQATVGDEAITGVKKPSTNNDATHNKIHRKASKGNLSSHSNGHKKSQSQASKDKQPPRTWETLTGNNAALFDVAGTLWEDQTRQTMKETKESKTARKQTKSLSTAPAVVSDFDDDWSNWDSPPPKSPTRWSGSTVVSDTATTLSKGGDDGDDTENAEDTASQKDEISWPGLDQFTPGQLKRTVTTLMSEWEKALTPPASTQQSPNRTSTNVPF